MRKVVQTTLTITNLWSPEDGEGKVMQMSRVAGQTDEHAPPCVCIQQGEGPLSATSENIGKFNLCTKNNKRNVIVLIYRYNMALDRPSNLLQVTWLVTDKTRIKIPLSNSKHSPVTPSLSSLPYDGAYGGLEEWKKKRIWEDELALESIEPEG